MMAESASANAGHAGILRASVNTTGSSEGAGMWAVVVRYAEAEDPKRPGKPFNAPEGAAVGSVAICISTTGPGSTTASLGVEVTSRDDARGNGVTVANAWAVAWGSRP